MYEPCSILLRGWWSTLDVNIMIRRVLNLQGEVERLRKTCFDKDGFVVGYQDRLGLQETVSSADEARLLSFQRQASDSEKMLKNTQRKLCNAQATLLRHMRVSLPEGCTDILVVYDKGSVLTLKYTSKSSKRMGCLIRMRGFDVIRLFAAQ